MGLEGCWLLLKGLAPLSGVEDIVRPSPSSDMLSKTVASLIRLFPLEAPAERPPPPVLPTLAVLFRCCWLTLEGTGGAGGSPLQLAGSSCWLESVLESMERSPSVTLCISRCWRWCVVFKRSLGICVCLVGGVVKGQIRPSPVGAWSMGVVFSHLIRYEKVKRSKSL